MEINGVYVMKKWSFGVVVFALFFCFARADEVTQAGLSKKFRAGLTVCIGINQADELQAIYKKRAHVVHAVSSDMTTVETLRSQLSQKGIHGRVGVSPYDGKKLPFLRNTVNLLLVSDFEQLQSAGLTLAECFRILAPYGTLIVKTSPEDAEAALGTSATINAIGECLLIEKKYPDEMDHWKQDFHDVARTRNSKDLLVAPPVGVKWISTDEMCDERQKMYSCNGRLAYIDAKPGDRLLTVRDAFNGIKLWEKVVGGPITMDQDVIYTQDKTTGKLVRLHAEDGRPLKEYPFGEDLLKQWSRGVLYGGITLYEDLFIIKNGHEARDVETGELVWKTDYADLMDGRFFTWIEIDKAQSSCVIGEGRIFTVLNQTTLLCVDAKNGKIKWEREIPIKTALGMHQQNILFTITDKKTYTAYSSETGEIAWSYTLEKSPKNILFMPRGDEVYIGRKGKASGVWAAKCDVLDLKTGAVKETKIYDPSIIRTCSDKLTTDRYMISGRSGITSFEEGKTDLFYAGLAECSSSGVFLPANGLLYQVFSRICGCYSYINKTCAFSPKKLEEKILPVQEPRLFKGLDYGTASPAGTFLAADWPTYRKDNQRSSFCPVSIQDSFSSKWEVSLGGKVSAPVVAGGAVFVTLPSKNKVIALDAETGKVNWEYLAGGKVDSPPTLWGNLALFGCRDGQVYCLNAKTGALVWRFMAARGRNLIPAEEGIESLWPVPGSVLIEDGIAYFAAGRHTHSDKGLEVYALECATGKVVWQKTVDGLYEDPGVIARTAAQVRNGTFIPRTYSADHPSLRTQKNDILLSDGKSIYLFNQQLDIKTGELIHKRDDNVMFSGAMGFLGESSTPPFAQKRGRKGWRFKGYMGTLLATDGKRLVGSTVHYDRTGDEFRAFRGVDVYKACIFYKHGFFGVRDVDAEVILNSKTAKGREQVETPRVHWSVDTAVDLVPRALILTKEKIITTTLSHPNLNAVGRFIVRSGGAFDGVSSENSKLMILSAEDGETLSQTPINGIPSHDGLVLADDKLFITTIDGTVICME